MAVTLKQIAELAGVSRGTVDRALYHRGRVNPEVAERIRRIARELGYQPNRAGRALALAKNPVRIGVLCQAAETPFINSLLEGVKQAAESLSGLGLEIIQRNLVGIDATEQLQALEELMVEGIQGLAMVPAYDPRVRARINEICEQGIPVVTFNMDIDGTERMCFVGLDNYLAGRACAGLMGNLLGGTGSVLVIDGRRSNRATALRADGFRAEMQACFPDVALLPTRYCDDNDAQAQRITEEVLRERPELGGIYICSNGPSGVCRGLSNMGKASAVRMICYDLVPENIRNLQDGRIDFLIGQDAHTQGNLPVHMLFNYLFSGELPEKEYFFTDIVIKTKYNI